jgi:hypothetical protein
MSPYGLVGWDMTGLDPVDNGFGGDTKTVKISSIRKALPESCLDFSSYYTFCRENSENIIHKEGPP